jgi:hypothetical protein
MLVLGLALVSFSCGSSKGSHRDDNGADVGKFDPTQDFIVRGQAKVRIVQGNASKGLLGNRREPTTISATVSAATRFNISTTNFVPPTNPEDGELSYGTIDITTLRDNDLRICGPGGNQRCTAAAIRTYTEGTPGPGLWNNTDAFGLPIKSTGGAEVGLDPAGAVSVANIAVPANQRIVRLSNFTANATLPVPYFVDFTDASAGSYESTIVIEYLVQ